ncbi:MAG: TetR family transcriptional regulator [Pseudolysinimonas sp.]
MRSPDPTVPTKHRIRDAAMLLFGNSGVDAVGIRAIAAAAQVSPALVIRHFGSKEGLVDAIDQHTAEGLAGALAVLTSGGDETPAALPQLLEQLRPESGMPRYLLRRLMDGGPAATRMFADLHGVSIHALEGMVRDGTAAPGDDLRTRALVLLVADLGVLLLRDRIAEALGADPLTPDGLSRYGAELLGIYQGGLRAPADHFRTTP